MQERANTWTQPLEDDMKLKPGLSRHLAAWCEAGDTLFDDKTAVCGIERSFSSSWEHPTIWIVVDVGIWEGRWHVRKVELVLSAAWIMSREVHRYIGERHLHAASLVPHTVFQSSALFTRCAISTLLERWDLACHFTRVRINRIKCISLIG